MTDNQGKDLDQEATDRQTIDRGKKVEHLRTVVDVEICFRVGKRDSDTGKFSEGNIQTNPP